MLNGEYPGEVSTGTEFPFYCPECKNVFLTLLGLLQHVSCHACKQPLEEGPIGELLEGLDEQYG